MFPRRGEEGTGLVDVLVGFFIFALLGVTTIAALTRVSHVTLAVQSDNQAAVLAHRLLAKANADGCGMATGYSLAIATAPTQSQDQSQTQDSDAPSQDQDAQSTQPYSGCTWGSNKVYSLADVLPGAASPNAKSPGASCSPAPSTDGSPLSQGACYQVGTTTDVAALTFSWAWSQANAAPSSCSGTPTMTTPPDEVIATATVWWPNISAGGWHSFELTSIEAVPPVVQSAWNTGGLGGIAVPATVGSPVSLSPVSTQWPGPIITTASATNPASATGCAWFPYVPAAPLGTYSATVGSVNYSVPAVSAGSWSGVSP